LVQGGTIRQFHLEKKTEKRKLPKNGRKAIGQKERGLYVQKGGEGS